MIEVSPGTWQSPQQVRQKLYESIVDEAMYIARGSEGAVSLEWVLSQPVFIRKKYLDQMRDEIKERNKMLQNRKTSARRKR